MQPIAGALRQSLISRQISEGLSFAANVEIALRNDSGLDPSRWIEELVWLSTFIDFDFKLRSTIEELRGRHSMETRGALLHCQAVPLLFVDAVVDMHNEAFPLAAERFRTVIGESAVIADQHLQLIACFYLARCLHYLNQFAEADEFCKRARQLGETLPDAALQIACLDVLRSRILLKLKPLKEALPIVTGLLDTSGRALQDSDDRVTRANILIFKAQVARRGPHEGKSALELLTDGVALFGATPSPHPVLARALLHRSRAKRDNALLLRRHWAETGDYDGRGEGLLRIATYRDTGHTRATGRRRHCLGEEI